MCASVLVLSYDFNVTDFYEGLKSVGQLPPAIEASQLVTCTGLIIKLDHICLSKSLAKEKKKCLQ